MKLLAALMAVAGVILLSVGAWVAFQSAAYSDARIWAGGLFAVGMVLTVAAGVVWPLRPYR